MQRTQIFLNTQRFPPESNVQFRHFAMVVDDFTELYSIAAGLQLQITNNITPAGTFLLAANNLSDVLSTNTSLNNLLPSQGGNAGFFLTTDGTNTSWAATGGGGGESLAATLAIGKITGGNDIVVSNTDFITGSGGQVQIDFGSDAYLYLNLDAGAGLLPYIDIEATFLNIVGVNGTGAQVALAALSTAVSHNLLVELISASTRIGSLAGVGTRMVTANATGVLSTAAIPSGAPALTATQIAFGDAGNLMTSDPLFFYNIPALTFSVSHANLGTFISFNDNIGTNRIELGVGTGNMLLLDNTNSLYEMGKLAGGNNTKVSVNDSTKKITVTADQVILSGANAGTTGTLLVNKGDSLNQYIVLQEAAGSPNSAYLTFKSTGGNAIAMGALFAAGVPTAYIFTDAGGVTLNSIDAVTGANTIANLAGVGTRTVVASATGVLSTIATVVNTTIVNDPNWTLLGQLVYGTGASTGSILAGHINADNRYLRQTGTGAVSAAPQWVRLDAGDITAGVLGVANGGTNIASYAVGDLIYASGATTLSKLADVAVGSYLRSGGVATAPLWSTLTLPDTAAISTILYASAANVISALSTANSGILITSAGGVPSIGTAIPNGVTATTQAANSNDTKVATDAYVDGKFLTWTDYSGTSTVTGFSSTTEKKIYYMTVGKMLIINALITGTSNTTGFTFTIPTAASANVSSQSFSCITKNSGSNASALVQVAASSTTVTVFQSATSATFTASGVKACFLGTIIIMTD